MRGHMMQGERYKETWGHPSHLQLDQSFEKEGRFHIELSFIVLLTALEMAHGETFRWRDGSANRLECTKKRTSLQNTRLPLHYDSLPQIPFLTVPMTRNSPECKNLYQIRWLWSIENHLARAG